MLRIRTLGGLSVQGADRAPAGAATQPRRLAVLALIARAGSRGVTREKLLALLWPDADEEMGRRALSQSLYSLRRDLGADELLLGVQELRLNPDVATCDVTSFEDALAERNLERAVELYGGPFLDGFRLPSAPEFDRWIDDERRSLAQRHVELLERLARKVAERDDPAAASIWWRRLAELDPLNARVAAELMRSLVAAGDSAGALKHARIYEALLEQELDLEPDREVIELARRIREDAAAPAAAAPAAAAPIREPIVEVPSAVDTSPLPDEHPPSAAGVAEVPAPRLPQARLPEARRRGARLATLALAVLLPIAALAWWASGRIRAADREPVLAVGRVIDYRTADRRAADAVSDMLATNLARVSGLQVLSSVRLYEVMAQVDDPRQSQASIEARAAQRAGATELLEGGLHALAGGRLLLDLRRVDLATGAVRTAYRLEGSDVYALVSEATEDLARSLDHRSGRLDPADVSTRSLVAYRFYEEGLRGYSRGDYRGAERLFAAAVAEDSSFAMAAFYLLMTRLAGDLAQPADAWERVVRLAERAPDRERLLIRGAWAQVTGRAELQAIADSLAARYPAEVDGPYLQGSARMVNGEFTAAIPYLERVLAMDSLGLRGESVRCRACDAIALLAGGYMEIDSLDAAERLARDWVRRQPRSARAWRALAGVLVAANRHDEAIEAQRTATSINPMNTNDRVFSSIVRIRRGDFEEADRFLRTLMRDGGAADAEEARWLLLISLRYQARWREALALIRTAYAGLPASARSNPQGRAFRNMEALTLLESGRPREAAAVWDTLARHTAVGPASDPRAARFYTFQYTLIASALAAAGDTAALIPAADSAAAWAARSINRRDTYLMRHARGLLLAARGDTAGAIASLDQAMYSPTGGFTRTNKELGRLLLARGRAADAIRVAGAALRGASLESGNLYVTHTELHELVAHAFDEAGMADSARVHYAYVASALERSDAEARLRYEAARRRVAAGASGLSSRAERQ